MNILYEVSKLNMYWSNMSAFIAATSERGTVGCLRRNYNDFEGWQILNTRSLPWIKANVTCIVVDTFGSLAYTLLSRLLEADGCSLRRCDSLHTGSVRRDSALRQSRHACAA